MQGERIVFIIHWKQCAVLDESQGCINVAVVRYSFHFLWRWTFMLTVVHQPPEASAIYLPGLHGVQIDAPIVESSPVWHCIQSSKASLVSSSTIFIHNVCHFIWLVQTMTTIEKPVYSRQYMNQPLCPLKNQSGTSQHYMVCNSTMHWLRRNHSGTASIQKCSCWLLQREYLYHTLFKTMMSIIDEIWLLQTDKECHLQWSQP